MIKWLHLACYIKKKSVPATYMLKNTSPFKRKRTNLQKNGKWLSLLTSTWWHGVHTAYSDTKGRSSSQRASPGAQPRGPSPTLHAQLEAWGGAVDRAAHTYSQGLQMWLPPPTAEKSSGIHMCWQLGMLRIMDVLGHSTASSAHNRILGTFLRNDEECHRNQRVAYCTL